MRTVTEITNNPGLKYTHIGIDSTGVNFYKEEVNTEFYKHRELLQENIDNKQKVIVKEQIEYKLPEVIKEDTFFDVDCIYDVSVDVKYKNIKVTNEDTGEVKIFETFGTPRRVMLSKNVLSYDDFIDETSSYYNYFIDINTEAVIGKRSIEASHSASMSWDGGDSGGDGLPNTAYLWTFDDLVGSTTISNMLIETGPDENIIDWGDNNTTTLIPNTNNNLNHTYNPSAGIEIISFTAKNARDFIQNPFTSIVYQYIGADTIDLIFDWVTNIPPTTLELETPSNYDILDPGSQTFTAPTFNIISPGTYEWRLYASDNTSQDAATVTITWTYPTYYGVSVDDLTIPGDPFILNGLRRILTRVRENQTLTFNATNEYIYFATPSGALTTILDANGLDVTNSFSLTVLEIYDGASSASVWMNVYKSNSLMTTNQNFQFIF